MPTLPTPTYGEPLEATAGATWTWRRALPRYPASDGWTLTYYVRGTDTLDIVATQDATTADYLVTVAAADTAGLTAGRYVWSAVVSDGAGTVFVADTGTLLVLANLATAAAGDLASRAEADLAAIDAVLSGRITNDVQSYSIAGRSLVKMPILELRQLRAELAWRVYAERNPGQLGVTVGARFVRP